eukprot:5995184-Pleurochrysis_carterae.AAC.1
MSRNGGSDDDGVAEGLLVLGVVVALTSARSVILMPSTNSIASTRRVTKSVRTFGTKTRELRREPSSDVRAAICRAGAHNEEELRPRQLCKKPMGEWFWLWEYVHVACTHSRNAPCMHALHTPPLQRSSARVGEGNQMVEQSAKVAEATRVFLILRLGGEVELGERQTGEIAHDPPKFRKELWHKPRDEEREKGRGGDVDREARRNVRVLNLRDSKRTERGHGSDRSLVRVRVPACACACACDCAGKCACACACAWVRVCACTCVLVVDDDDDAVVSLHPAVNRKALP